MSSGQDLGSVNSSNATASGFIPLAQAQDLALTVTMYFEGGNSAYQALADDFDGMGTSFGLIQWNFGAGTLGPLLLKMMTADPSAFAACFGPNANFDALKAAITSASVSQQLSWARGLIASNRPAWKAAFVAIGSNATFNQIQRQQAIAHYHSRALTVINNLRRISSALMVNVEVRSYVAIFDLCVQQNGIDNVLDAIKAKVAATPPATQVALVTIAVQQRALAAKAKYVADCMSRRMGILTGANYTATENGVTSTRQNPKLGLIAAVGSKFVEGL